MPCNDREQLTPTPTLFTIAAPARPLPLQLSFENPGANAWVSDGDPLTIVGGIGFADYAVLLSNVTFAAGPVLPRDADGAPAAVAPCNASDPFQSWVWGAPAAGYVSNAAASQCLNVYGCQDSVVYWSCVTSGGTCCGPDCYTNLQWALSGAGQLVTADTGGGCVTASGDAAAPSFTITRCGPPGQANQTWTQHTSSGLLELGTTGQCLAAPAPPPPPPPPTPYTQVGGARQSIQPE